MSAPLFGEDAPDAEDFVVSWLQPLLRSGVERRQSDPWPFALVQRISGLDNPEAGLDDPVVQVDILHKVKSGTVPVAVAGKQWANDVHRRMTLLGLTYPDVTLSDGSVAGIDYLTVLIRPHREPFGDETVARYVARYKLGLSYVAV
jgi:hypothetical protein